MSVAHVSVLLAECVQLLNVASSAKRDRTWWVDGTVGLAGHSEALLKVAGPGARLLGLDKDPAALKLAGLRLEAFQDQVVLRQGSFADPEALKGWLPAGERLDGVLLDLGVSSLQLDTPERGFSFRFDAPLDMRMDTTQGLSAAQWLEHVDQDELTQVLREFGEEPKAPAIARSILAARPLKSTADLALAVGKILGKGKPGGRHPATRVFQALRLVVNHELEDLSLALPAFAGRLRRGGRLAVISFHSLEDRLVKDYFKAESRDCICPPGLPECRCGHKASLLLMTKKGVEPSDAELALNPRARSARLRVVERIAP